MESKVHIGWPHATALNAPAVLNVSPFELACMQARMPEDRYSKAPVSHG